MSKSLTFKDFVNRDITKAKIASKQSNEKTMKRTTKHLIEDVDDVSIVEPDIEIEEEVYKKYLKKS